MFNPLLLLALVRRARATDSEASAEAWAAWSRGDRRSGAQPRNTAPPAPPVPYDPPRGPAGASGGTRPDPWDDEVNAEAGYARPSRTVHEDQGEELLIGNQLEPGMLVLLADPSDRSYDAKAPIKDRDARWCIVEQILHRGDAFLFFVGRYPDGSKRPRRTSRAQTWIVFRDGANLPASWTS